MAAGGTAAVLRRKVERAREAGTAAAPGQATPQRALCDAIRRAAEEELSLAISPAEPRMRRATPDEIVEGLPEQGLLALLTGPGGGAGLICLDPGALSAIVEMRTIGRVTSRPPPSRRPTPTDAALAADFIDAVLAAFEAALARTEDWRWAAGWRYAMFLPEPRPLPVVLEEAQHRVAEVDLSSGAAGKPGRLVLALPATGRAPPRPAPEAASPSAPGAARAAWNRALGEAVGTAEALIGAVLGRVRIDLADLARLAPGDRIVLPAGVLGQVLLTGPGGAPVAGGRLGQLGGLRAVKVARDDSPVAPAPALGVVVPAGALASSGGASATGWPGARTAHLVAADPGHDDGDDDGFRAPAGEGDPPG
jgi:flagellar motor switch protein FliM